MYQFFETAGVGQRVFESHAVSHSGDGELGVGEQILGFIDPELCHILMYSHAGMLLKQLAEIKFGKTDAVADGIDVQIVLIVFLDKADGRVDGSILHRGQILGGQDVLGQLVQIQQKLVDLYAGLHLVHQYVFGRTVIDLKQVQKMVKDTAQLVRVEQTVAFADHIVKMLGLHAADNNIEEIFFTVPGLGEAEGRITG